ncbi:hypothetical protein COU37_00090 [Candidatus Micrarchaeota archaeon CG10_big_fil_rev_8_21_14_0_10_45_29]|nr:MAG: hypothetical protein COU37_00090 [Candidatus Micrarchaeota archaeon CG10_big_fil_rev_8_21_14_0_10_45_29]
MAEPKTLAELKGKPGTVADFFKKNSNLGLIEYICDKNCLKTPQMLRDAREKIVYLLKESHTMAKSIIECEQMILENVDGKIVLKERVVRPRNEEGLLKINEFVDKLFKMMQAFPDRQKPKLVMEALEIESLPMALKFLYNIVSKNECLKTDEIYSKIAKRIAKGIREETPNYRKIAGLNSILEKLPEKFHSLIVLSFLEAKMPSLKALGFNKFCNSSYLHKEKELLEAAKKVIVWLDILSEGKVSIEGEPEYLFGSAQTKEEFLKRLQQANLPAVSDYCIKKLMRLKNRELMVIRLGNVPYLVEQEDGLLHIYAGEIAVVIRPVDERGNILLDFIINKELFADVEAPALSRMILEGYYERGYMDDEEMQNLVPYLQKFSKKERKDMAAGLLEASDSF